MYEKYLATKIICLHALVFQHAKNPVNFVELSPRQLMILHNAAQAFAPIRPWQPGPVEIGLGQAFGDEPDVQKFAVHQVCRMSPRHFRWPIQTQTPVGYYSHC